MRRWSCLRRGQVFGQRGNELGSQRGGGGMLAKGRVDDRTRHAAGKQIPASELSGSRGLADPGFAMQEDDGLGVKGAVQGQQSVVAAVKPQVRWDRQGGGRASDVRVADFRLADQVQRSGFVRHRHQPIGYRDAVVLGSHGLRGVWAKPATGQLSRRPAPG
jgi:hypothetical protein